jgi:hypothetical protein
LDTRPTTEERGGLNWDQQLDVPEVKSGVTLPQKISELRKKLGQRAKQELKFRFYALYDRIYRDDVLRFAATLVLNHNGAAGVDGVTCQDLLTLDEPGWNAFFRELHEELRTKRYRPQPVKRVYIPKPDGRLRPLGIPICRSYCTSLQRCWGLIERSLAQHWALFLWRNRLSRPSATGWLTQASDDLRRELDPPWCVRGRLDPIQNARLAPIRDRRYIHIEQVSGGLRGISSIRPVTLGARLRCLLTTTYNRITTSKLRDDVSSESTSSA